MGKSTVAEILTSGGVAVVDTDDLARQVVQPGEPALAEIRATFGDAVFDAQGWLLREALAEIVFREAAARKRLEAILHPRIQERWQMQLADWRQERRTSAAVIIPLLFETRVESEFDSVICVACAAVTQRRRLRERGWSEQHIQERLAAQLPATEKMARAHRVIWNEGDREVLSWQCERILRSAV